MIKKLAGKALHVVHFYFSAASAKSAIYLESRRHVVEIHLVPAMQTESAGDILHPVRLVRPVGPELPQERLQFFGRWQPAGFVHMPILPPKTNSS
jgi:hypothetical protein